MTGSAVTVLGYLERCDGCGTTALLAEPIQRPLFEWTCPACDGLIDGPAQPAPEPMARTYAILRLLVDSMQAVQSLKQKGALLDTVDALDDEDPEPEQLAPEGT